MSIEQLSIRAKTYVAACALEKYCTVLGIKHASLDEFCSHMKSLAIAKDIPSWDSEANQLEITGLGDPLPEILGKESFLHEVTECVREISAVNIYGSYRHLETQSCFKRVIDICKLEISPEQLKKFNEHSACSSGWGVALSEEEYVAWRNVL